MFFDFSRAENLRFGVGCRCMNKFARFYLISAAAAATVAVLLLQTQYFTKDGILNLEHFIMHLLSFFRNKRLHALSLPLPLFIAPDSQLTQFSANLLNE